MNARRSDASGWRALSKMWIVVNQYNHNRKSRNRNRVVSSRDLEMLDGFRAHACTHPTSLNLLTPHSNVGTVPICEFLNIYAGTLLQRPRSLITPIISTNSSISVAGGNRESHLRARKTTRTTTVAVTGSLSYGTVT